MKLNKKLVSAVSATILSVSAVATTAIAEVTPVYINHSDFSDCAIGGATEEGGIYGTGIIMDGSPWLTKGSSDITYATYLRDEERGVNYCRFYANCEKAGAFGAGSKYVYQRDTSANYTKEYGLCEFDVRLKAGSWSMMFGDFTDATSNTNYIAGEVLFSDGKVTASSVAGSRNIAELETDKWYKVRITVNNKVQEYNVKITDMDGNVVGTAEAVPYVQRQATGIRTWCFSYVKNAGAYCYDVTDVTIDKSSEAYEM